MRRRWQIEVSLLDDGSVDLVWITRWHDGEAIRAWSLDWPNDKNVLSAFATAYNTLDFQPALW